MVTRKKATQASMKKTRGGTSHALQRKLAPGLEISAGKRPMVSIPIGRDVVMEISVTEGSIETFSK